MKIVLGVSGGIAAFKSCQVVRRLKEQGHDVQVIPTDSSLEFVGRATWEALSGHSVSSSVFDGVPEVRHVRTGQDAELFIVAPATADIIARLAHGRSDDLLTASALMARCPIVVFPAMHTEMWTHPATQDNVATLRGRGVTVIDPAHGRLTGPDSGPGRFADPDQVVNLSLTVARRRSPFPRDLEGRRVLITAGGTHESVDPVRFIGNRSSGKQGFALAEIAAARGAEVIVVAGATHELPTPLGAEVVRVESARDMYAEVERREMEVDIVVCAAAVADYRPAEEKSWKMKKSAADSDGNSLMTLSMVENPDILKSVVSRRQQRSAHTQDGGAGADCKPSIVVGFAAETGDPDHTPLEHSEMKLKDKNCELLVCNDVAGGKVFGRDTNTGWVLSQDGRIYDIPTTSKCGLADSVWDAVVDFEARGR
ncbi:bifunctional phosphopantothenoylcysteine decarboxylase/phosphopantothenate--cysteine ligase CoaBC [Corynebacterium kroppenstedtii]|uniref:bifunctional phosphopantothenoylcysteine decarboxylase/phosphopantothenate--cysteine ligase CoaBC n=1 Tax=Corynebacterium sp. PCR 32 TaxID=3351342 RepID=UPI0030956376